MHPVLAHTPHACAARGQARAAVASRSASRRSGAGSVRDRTSGSGRAVGRAGVRFNAVGAVQSWDGLRARTCGGRRVYTLVQRSLPLRPLAFTSVALAAAAPSRLAPLLREDGLVPDDPAAARTAVFFSICSTAKVCQQQQHNGDYHGACFLAVTAL